MNRKRLPRSQRTSRQLHVLVTEAEAREIREAADQKRETLSSWVRRVAVREARGVPRQEGAAG